MIVVDKVTKWFKQQMAVHEVSFAIEKGTTVALVGESGCGKSTLGKLLLRLIHPTSGALFFEGRSLASFTPTELKAWRKKAQIVFQDPYASLNPRMTVARILEEPLLIHNLPRSRVLLESALTSVQLHPTDLEKYPHAFSGGQRQRIGIARALMSGPEFIVCDECVASLDSDTQEQILTLLKNLQRERSLTYLFISHNLHTVRLMADVVAVMYHGRLVEIGPTDQVLSHPKHPYTQKLVAHYDGF